MKAMGKIKFFSASLIVAAAMIIVPCTVLAGGAGPEPGSSNNRFVAPPFQGSIKVTYVGVVIDEFGDIWTRYDLEGTNIALVGNNSCMISFDLFNDFPVEVPEEEFPNMVAKDFRNWEIPWFDQSVEYTEGCEDVYPYDSQNNILDHPGFIKVLAVSKLTYFSENGDQYYLGNYILMPFNKE